MEQILIFKHDLAKYPPLITIIEVLLKNDYSVELWGYCSDENILNRFSHKFHYEELIVDDVNVSSLKKYVQFIKYRSKVKSLLKNKSKEKTRLWVFNEQTLWVTQSVIKDYNKIIYLFEIPSFKVLLNYKLFCKDKEYIEAMQSADKVVCCEPNRASITAAIFGLKRTPYVIPNKPTIISEDSGWDLSYLKEKKIILYQGIFRYPERRLDEFCQAIKYLPNDFVLILMGGPENEYRNSLKLKYESDRIIFLPFISPPKHLDITQKAYIGILSYDSMSDNILSVLNLLYCAPNKIYEYGRYGVPMVTNNLPALHYIFNQFNAGIMVDNYEPRLIADAILKIDAEHDKYKCGALTFYNSIDMEESILALMR